jgi:hypothetical protein
MGLYHNPYHELEQVITCYERDFGIRLSFEDADRMLTLFDELCDLFQKYESEDGNPLELLAPLLGA